MELNSYWWYVVTMDPDRSVYCQTLLRVKHSGVQIGGATSFSGSMGMDC